MPHPFRAAVEAKDIEAIRSVLAEDVEFRSPVAFPPYRGRNTVAELLRNVMDVFQDFTYVGELEGPGTHALIFEAKVGGRDVQGLDHLVVDEHGLIKEFTVMVRPLSGVIALAEAMGPRVEHLPKG